MSISPEAVACYSFEERCSVVFSDCSQQLWTGWLAPLLLVDLNLFCIPFATLFKTGNRAHIF